MAAADLLLELIFSWIEQRELCAEQLRKLAQELESLREKCNASECVGSSVSVVGAACLIGAGAATLFTGGAAAPFLGVLGAAYSGVGVAISVVTKITEHFSSSNTMKEAQKIEKKSNEIGEKIQKLFEQLKAERKEVSSFTDPDELDRHIMTEILRAVARRSGLKQEISVRMYQHMFDNEPQFYFDGGPGYMRHNQSFFNPALTVGLAGILIFFTFQGSGKKSKLLFAQGAKQLIKQMSTTGFKTALKGGAMVVGGAVGMAFALPEAIDNWKDQIKKNHVTQASQSLRDTADAILKITRTLREQLDDIKRMLEELAKSQQEHEEKLSREKNTQDCKEKPETLNKDNIMSSNPAQEKSRNQETQTDQRHDDEQENDQTEQNRSEQERESEQNEETGSEQQGGDDEGDKESDGEDEESDQEEEESDSEEETEDDESKQTGRKKKTKCHRKNRTQSNQRGESDEVVDQCQDSCISQDQSESSTNKESNHEFETNQTPPTAIRVGSLNVRSMNNKPSRVKELITQNNRDVFLTTETWLREDTGDRVLRDASPEKFNFIHQARGGRGGGVAIQFLNELQGEQILFDFITTFEYVATVLQHDEWDEPVLIINVYHPPGYNLTRFRAFLDEFQLLLDEAFKNYTSIIVTGDFNIWVDHERRSSTDEFEFFLLINNLVQHVEEPTHQAGHFLDLVITRNVEISGLFVRDDGISDHYTVYFNARPVSKDTREKTKENMDQDEQAKRFKNKEE